MPWLIKAWPKIPDDVEDVAAFLEGRTDNGVWHYGIKVYAQWDQSTKSCVGWVVKAGAEKYAQDYLNGSLLKLRWEIEEYD
jgi:hypothetical protein